MFSKMADVEQMLDTMVVTNSWPTKLRLMTYLSPGLPLELYQLYQYYLEEELNISTTLCVESRCSGPLPGQVDPFTNDVTDIAFMCGTAYGRLRLEGVCQMTLLPAAPVHIQAENAAKLPVYFSHIIVNSRQKDKFKSLEDLRMAHFAFNDEESLSGKYTLLAELSNRKLEKNFFGRKTMSGGHLQSLALLLEEEVDYACVDSIIWTSYQADHPFQASQLFVLETIGPQPVQPLVINSRLPDSFKHRVTEALLNMHTLPHWHSRLCTLGVEKFSPVSEKHYESIIALRKRWDILGTLCSLA